MQILKQNITPKHENSENFILQRYSVPARCFTQDPISDEKIQTILQSSLRAADHGAVRPYRFKILKNDDRLILGDLMARSLNNRDQTSTQALLDRERQKPLRAPIVILVAAQYEPLHAKIPLIEQQLTMGCAIQNMLNMAYCLDIGAIFLTGKSTYDTDVRDAFFSKDVTLVGYLYIGNYQTDMLQPRPTPDIQDYIL